MSDVKDILGMARPAPTPLSFDAEPKAPKAPKSKRPEGMSREAYALLGDSAPVVPSHTSESAQPQGLKEKRKLSARGQVCLWPVTPLGKPRYLTRSCVLGGFCLLAATCLPGYLPVASVQKRSAKRQPGAGTLGEMLSRPFWQSPTRE